MNKRVTTAILILCALTTLLGCMASTDKEVVKVDEAPPQVETKSQEAKAPEGDAPKWRVVELEAEKAPAPPIKKGPPPPSPAEPERLTLEESQRRRALERELGEAVKEYWQLLERRNVTKAVEYVEAMERENKQQELYKYIAKKKVNSFDVDSTTIDFEADPASATINGILTDFARDSVAPDRSTVKQWWLYAEGGWKLVREE
ncbi:MAG: hypothetical protein C0608_09235 [Deltaproteobacteria bacterium]|nr:MAG: hypothetical protein C0608_09235 [Deltaproteobacteria bacterium]